MQESADGADDLADGVKQYTGGVSQLNKQFPAFAQGVGDTADGSKDLAKGTKSAGGRLESVCARGAGDFSAGLQTVWLGSMNGFTGLSVKTLERSMPEPFGVPSTTRTPVRALLRGPGGRHPGRVRRAQRTRATSPVCSPAAKGLASGADTPRPT